jgi:hypothetical protein
VFRKCFSFCAWRCNGRAVYTTAAVKKKSLNKNKSGKAALQVFGAVAPVFSLKIFMVLPNHGMVCSCMCVSNAVLCVRSFIVGFKNTPPFHISKQT